MTQFDMRPRVKSALPQSGSSLDDYSVIVARPSCTSAPRRRVILDTALIVPATGGYEAVQTRRSRACRHRRGHGLPRLLVEDSPAGVRLDSRHIRAGVLRTVANTGSVITSAGIIFAAGMLGLLVGSVAIMIQTGLIIGCGLLLDTFLVRTLTVPAVGARLREASWWPQQATSRSAKAFDSGGG